MDLQGFTLNGSDLSFSDLQRLSHSQILKIDADTLSLCSSSPTPSSSPISLIQSSTFLGIALNNYLRTPSACSSDVLQSLTSSPCSSLPSIITVPESDTKYFTQDVYKITSELIQVISDLSELAPIVDAGIAMNMEASNFDSALISEELFSVSSQGLKTTLGNVATLLSDSKLAKKNSPSEDVIEMLQVSAGIKDVLEEAERVIEREVNAVPLHIKKTVVNRSTIGIVRLLGQLILVSSRIFENGLEKVQFNPSLHKYVDLIPSLQSLQAYTAALLPYSLTVLMKSFTTLSELEAKINIGAAKPRPLQLGKGSRLLYQHLKDFQPTPTDLAKYLQTLLESKNEERRVPKIAKGMRDYASEEMTIREYVFNVIRGVFKKHMADELDTPVMELRETLTGKYGEEGGKLIYNIADQGGELLSLRYDLTVPFARYVAINRLSNWKRFQIGKVYRRDQPQMKRGRYREFYQCDFDIVGTGSPMSQDAEVLKIVVEILRELEFNFIVKINHRKLLDSLLDISGCPSEKYRTVSSSIDKLDKEPWSKVRLELIEDKGVTVECADKIGEYVKINGSPEEVLERLKGIEEFSKHDVASKVLVEVEKLVGLLNCLGILKNLSFDLSLARGLDYYTGLVYEAVIVDGAVGSIAGGGRYDELIMKLNNSNQPTPAIGVSLGVERLFTILEERYKAAKASAESAQGAISSILKSKSNSVLVAQAGNSDRFNLLQERFKILNTLWSNGLNAETSYKEKSDPKSQAGYASQQGIRWVVWVGETELAEGKVKVKDLTAHNEEVILLEEVAQYILRH